MDDLKGKKGLESLRREIDLLDKTLLEIFENRMAKVLEIASYKQENELAVLDESREKEVLNNTRYLKNKEFKEPAEKFFKAVMEISKSIQNERISRNALGENIRKVCPQKRVRPNITAGFQGLPGSYSEQALREYFGGEAGQKSFPNFEDVFSALEAGEIDYGVLPLENSYTGGIAEVYDLLCRYGFYIVGEKGVRIDHNLLAVKGSRLEDIKEVYSHPQAFRQCSKILRDHPQWNLISCSNTAVSAKLVSESSSLSKAAIAGRRAANLYGLEILQSGINNNPDNFTRFIIIGREPEIEKGCNKISLVVALSHQPGSLYRVLSHFAVNGLNMLKIESRPIINRPWEYLFYIDFEGCLKDKICQKAVKGIRENSTYFQLLGNYPSGISFINT